METAESEALAFHELLNAYNRICAALEVAGDDAHRAVCIAVTDFFQSSHRLPKRQGADTDEKRAEDALAQRWDRLLAEKGSISSALLSTYSGIFKAAEMEDDEADLAVCSAVHDSQMRSKGSRFTLGVWGLRVCSLDVAEPFATVRVRAIWPCLW